MDNEQKEKYFTIMANYKRMASNLISQISSYEAWGPGFCRDEVKSLYARLIKEFDGCDFTQFSPDELKTLDFRYFDEDVICMPLWALDCLADGTEICSISGDIRKFDKSKGLSKDVRFGVTAYGFNKSQLRDSTIDKILDKDDKS